MNSGYNMYLITIPRASTTYINIYLFDDSLNYQSFGIQYHSSSSPKYVDNKENKRMLYGYSVNQDFYYLAINFQQFWTSSGSAIETVILKMDYNPRLSGIHLCHKWIEFTTAPVSTSTPSYLTTTVPAANKQQYMFEWKTLVTFDNGLIRLE
jgi:hypothetical protein